MKPFKIKTLFSGLSRQILLWLLLISLLPFSLVGTLAYFSAKDNLLNHAYQSLANNIEEKAAFIENWFHYRFIDLKLQATNSQNILFLETFQNAHKESNLPLNEFVKSYQWNLISEERNHDLSTFIGLYGYYDIFLIDLAGDILFTLTHKKELGTNLFTGPLAKTAFSSAAKKTLRTGKPNFSDLMNYASPYNEISGFFISIMLNSNGDKIGLLAIQVNNEQIEYALHKHRSGESRDIQSYIIGQTENTTLPTLRTALTNNFASNAANYLTQQIDTEQSHLWLKIHNSNTIKNTMMIEKGHIYIGPNGTSVLGAHRNISIGNIHWGIVAEVAEASALAPIKELTQIAVVSILIISVAVLALAILLTRLIVNPISAISTALTKVSKGDIQQWIEIEAKYELESLILGFNQMIGTINDVADQADAIALGDYSADIKLKSDKDKLGIALQGMIRNLRNFSLAAEQVANGDTSLTVAEQSSNDLLAKSFNAMILSLQQAEKTSQTLHWLQTGNDQIKDKFQGIQTLEELANKVIRFLCSYMDAQIGIFYMVDAERIKLAGSYAFKANQTFSQEFGLGDGLVGQAALEQKRLTLTDIPDDYLIIQSGLGETPPKVITIHPIIWNGEVIALLEFGTFKPFSETHESLIETAAPSIAVAILTALERDKSQELLEQTQSQAKELQAHEEELQSHYELLEKQAQKLKLSEQRLLNNQNQLEANNRELEQKADELAQSSKYKSEFLANMSHELRTPLNSMLVLSKMLANNKEGHLTEREIEFSNTIYESGNDLLILINDILDLSKIESGKMELHIERLYLSDFIASLNTKFQPLAANKGINFRIDDAQAPKQCHTDQQKLGQIIKNLLSNAIKFTTQGEVVLKIGPVDCNTQLHHPNLTPKTSFAIAVVDSGIGIPADKYNAIFEAFQQADGTTSRQYGGTGLGLSISRELTKIIGGEIQVKR
ncbi:MAG: ATP-binding protein [Candidatus Polarisedimenticolaceae bacterium]|nr:ATP-binding protein [Candidatus Polarisedimenticolaceae bacterium]